MNVGSQHYVQLDGLRGVAALVVLVGHAWPDSVHNILLAVYFFFALSGFVISLNYEHRFSKGYSLKDFFLSRVIRLYPMIFFGACLGFLNYMRNPNFFHDPYTALAVVGAILALPTPTPSYSFGTFPLNPPEWSLFFEIVMYVGFGLLIRFASTVRLFFFIAVCLGFYCCRLAFVTDVNFFMAAAEAFLAFSIGILVARYREVLIKPIYSAPFWVLSLIIVCCCALPKSLGLWVAPFFIVFITPLVLISGASNGTGHGAKSIVLLGVLSYPLYISHWSIIIIVRRHLEKIIGFNASTVVACAIAIAVSWVALRVYDQPLRKWLTRWAKNTQSARLQAPAP